MAEMSFNDVIEWLATKEGESVAVEIGSKDRTTDIDAMTIPLVMRVTLGSVELPPLDQRGSANGFLIELPEMRRSRMYLDPVAVTKVEAVPGMFRLWFHDAFYVGFSG